jgi:hypothetical protein
MRKYGPVNGGAETYRKINSAIGKLFGYSAAFAAALSVGEWLLPTLVRPIAVAAMLIGFLIAFLGVPTMMVVAALRHHRGRSKARRRWWEPSSSDLGSLWKAIPSPVGLILAAICSIALVSALVGLFQTRGFSQNTRGSLPSCEWSIFKDHGATNICVSHSRWVATGDEVERAILGFLALFLSVECAVVLAHPVNFAGDTTTPPPPST